MGDSLGALQQKRMLEHLFYALSGFDTSSIYLESTPTMLTVVDFPEHLVKPFEYLIMKIREYHFDEEALCFVSQYLRRLSELKGTVTAVEELYVRIGEYAQMFQELDRLKAEYAEERVNMVQNMHASTGNTPIHEHFMHVNRRKLAERIERWINDADPSELVNAAEISGFNSCFWSDMFRIKSIGLSRSDRMAIEDCGKMVYMIRMVFEREIIEDGERESKCSLLKGEFEADNRGCVALVDDKEDERHGRCMSHSNTDECINAKGIDACHAGARKEWTESKITGIQETASNKQNLVREQSSNKENNINWDAENAVGKAEPGTEMLAPVRVDLNDMAGIHQRRFEISRILNGLIFEGIRSEVRAVHAILYAQDASFLLEILDEFHSTFISCDSAAIHKVNAWATDRWNRNACRYFSCLLSNVSLGEYILRLLKTQSAPQANTHLTVLERFSVEFEPRYLQYLLPPRTFVELKIIARFLFMVSAILYFIERSHAHNFTRIIYLIFMRIKKTEVKNIMAGTERVDIDDFISRFKEQMNGLLSDYFLSNADVFTHWDGLMALCLEYIQTEFKENVDATSYNARLRTTITALQREIIRSVGENDFTEFLQGLEWDKYF